MENISIAPATSPANILRTGMGFWPSRILLTAVKFQLFTKLAAQPSQSASDIKEALCLNCSDRYVYDWLDALTALGFLERTGLLQAAQYSNSTETDFFLDKNKPSYVGGILELANRRLYNSWGKLDHALSTGKLQDQDMAEPGHSFEEVYKTPEKLKEFLDAMSGINMADFRAFAKSFDLSGYKTLIDAGGAGGQLSIAIARQHPSMLCTTFDLPIVGPVALQNVQRSGLENVRVASGDFFTDALPAADVIVMANVLHDWEEEKKLLLIKKAYDALPSNGAFVAIEHVIDDQRRKNAFGMMMSLNMLLQTGKGFDYTYSDFRLWANATGFVRTALIPLTEQSSAVVAYKG